MGDCSGAPDQALLEAWMAGGSVAGVGFALSQAVRVTTGAHAGSLGTVASLLAVRPEPVYTVQLGAGRADVHLPESALAAA